MELIRLPARVGDVVACAELNRKVRHGLCALDWSEVAEVDPQAAAALLREIDLERIPDGLGMDSMPEAVAGALLATLEARRVTGKASAAGPKGSRAGRRAAGAGAGAQPGVWTAPGEPGGAAGSSHGAAERRKEPALAAAPRRPHEPALQAPDAQKLRALLEERVIADLLGPAGGEEEEVAENSIRDRYLVGLLAPKRQRVRLEQMDALETGGDAGAEDGLVDATTPSAPTMFPSAIGVSFCVAPGTAVRVRAAWGRYLRGESATQRDEAGKPLRVWKRTPMREEIGPLTLQAGPIGPLPLCADQPQVVVRGVANEAPGALVVSLFLVNGQDEPAERRDEAWLFQPELSVEGEGGGAVFLGRAAGVKVGDGLPLDEETSMAMLYRDQVELAVGHGVSVHAEPARDDPRRATRVTTVVVPRHEVGAQRARMPPRPAGRALEPEEDPALEGVLLDMRALAELPTDHLGAALRPLPAAYRAWIERQRARVRDPGARLAGFEATADAALGRAERALARIERGIALLGKDDKAAEAFRFANRAMWLQRVHSKLAEQRRRGEQVQPVDVDTPENRTWRTFQLAFLLLNLESCTDLTHDDRTDPAEAIADLLWFPTGGGKTEAYLGVAAYVMALRRLQGVVAGRSGEHGVAVLMRYTLRLLTLQQFQRAATLICACEAIRREALAQGDARWGREPFRIGLWVGARSTPNKTDHADEALKRLRGSAAEQRGGFGGLGSPVQLKSCPWCGTAIEPGRDLRVLGASGGPGRTLMFCGDPRGGCLFSERGAPNEGLPVLVVDEEIYRRAPTLLIATVDKFAQMPWRGEVQMLFGQVDSLCPRHGFRSPETDDADSHPAAGRLPAVRSVPHGPLRPPDLIIQDELHLISGPLGTLTGLYETAVDELCAWEVDGKRVRPKVIASTATVRRAEQQVHALFLRRVEVFPPHGLDATDSFFSIQRSPDEVPGRRYLGICAPGRRLKAALIRVYVAFLSAAQQLYEESGRHADPWMTLVGYFGSLRELAGMRRLVDDDVRTRVFRMQRRGLASRSLGEPKELTSRLGSTEIPELLDRLEVPFDPATEGQGRGRRVRRPIDVLLATNMISVGVDVQRLGLMVCAGQPKTTAEYIQATSRVGRDKPGLVCTIYNWARPRDLSHYETFEHYHATFYQHVEALSVTPFAPRALDRALSALLVSLVRLSGARFNPNDAAALVDPGDTIVRRAVEVITRRAEHVEESRAVAEEVRRLLESRLQQWRAEATPRPGKARLGYRAKRDGVTRELLKPAGVGPLEPFTCLSSLRDVEPTVDLVLEDGGLDDEPLEKSGGAS